MRTVRPIPPDVAFPNPARPPTDDEVRTMLGAAAQDVLEEFDAHIDSAHPGTDVTWGYSTAAGWYRISTLRRQRLFYLVPRQGDFRLNIVLGYRAIASLADGPHAVQITGLLQQAERYTDGTLFSFDHQTLDCALALALIQARLAHP